MTEVVKFSDATNLGFHAMIQLSQAQDGEIPLKDIAAAIEVSEAHLSKVMQRLRKVGLVSSTRGPTGGYRLAKTPETIRFYDILVAIDGPILPRFCLFKRPVCKNATCGLGKFVGKLNLNVKTYLENLNLAQVVSIANTNQAA